MGLLKICDRIIARTNMFGRQCGKTNLLISLLARYSLLSNIVTNFKGQGVIKIFNIIFRKHDNRNKNKQYENEEPIKSRRSNEELCEYMKRFCDENCIFFEDNSCRGVKCEAKETWQEIHKIKK